MAIKAIIFDFDGVIVESMDIKAKAFVYLFKDYPEHVDKIVKWHILHGGISRFEKFEHIYKNILHLPFSKKLKNELGKKFKDFVYQEVISCPFVKGAQEFLNKYYQKLSFFIVSGTPQEEIVSIVKKRKLSKFFIAVFGAPTRKDVLSSRILNKFNLKPKEVIFVGDSIDDYEAVQKNGIRFVARATNENNFAGLKAEALISDISELEEVIHG